VTYGTFVVDIKDHKEEKERTRLTVRGDQIEYPGNKSTQTAGLTTEKISSTASFPPWEQNSMSLTLMFLLEHPPRTIRIYGHQLIVAPSGDDP
jgi:hypothetical protein